jgi:hypothetical protein
MQVIERQTLNEKAQNILKGSKSAPGSDFRPSIAAAPLSAMYDHPTPRSMNVAETPVTSVIDA